MAQNNNNAIKSKDKQYKEYFAIFINLLNSNNNKSSEFLKTFKDKEDLGNELDALEIPYCSKKNKEKELKYYYFLVSYKPNKLKKAKFAYFII